MPPSRRRPPPSAGQVPPVRRPRVAGLRNRPGTARDTGPDTEHDTEHDAEPTSEPTTEPDPELDTDPEGESISGTLDPEPRDTAGEPAGSAVADTGTVGAGPGHGDEVDEIDDRLDEAGAPAPAPSRPAGKRRATGTTRPANLSEAEERTRSETARAAGVEDNPRRRGATQLSVAVVLVVVAVVLAGLAVWFRGEAADLKSADHNTALTDPATTSEVIGQLKSAVEQTFSYNYTDLQTTQKAVDESLTGKARCEYDQLFGQVKELAPKQKIVMVTAVRDIALVRLDGDRAEALVFIDQSSTRVDVNNSVAGEAQFAVLAHREGDSWKITEFNMFDQPLMNGQPVPEC